ncbi:MAG: ROK family protein [bacterium]|nr:ROK family protein [bacterium]
MKKIGIDIGGSKIRAVLWNGKKVLAARQVKTPKNLHDFKKNILKLVTWLSDNQVEKIGIGAAGIISWAKIVQSPNIKYLKHFDFRSLRFWTSKLKIDNDARCFARSIVESAEGKILKNKTILAITLGTGIGRALIKNGKVLRIKKFEHPEKWEGEYQKIQNDDKRLAEIVAKNLIKTMKPFQPDELVFGGGVMLRKGFLEKLRKEFLRCEWNGVINISKFSKNAVAIGATLLA